MTEPRPPPTPARAHPVSRRAPWLLAAATALATLGGAYSNHFDNSFHFDDSHVIQSNVWIRSLANVPRFFTDAHTFSAFAQNATYRPLLSVTYALDHALGDGLAPRQFHVTQFAFLVVLWACLVALYRRLFDLAEPTPLNPFVALFAATLYCVHTANTQTVNYVSSRSALLGTLGIVGSLLVWVAWPRGRRTLLYLLPMVAGALAKPIAVMFAPILFAYVLLVEQAAPPPGVRRPPARRALAAALVQSAPAFVTGIALYFFIRGMDASTVDYGGVSRLRYLHTQVFVWLHYVRLFLLPMGLTADTDWTFFTEWYDTRFFAGLLFAALAVWAAVRLAVVPRLRIASFGIIWFTFGLVPESTIFPLYEVYNEHRIFLPWVGLTLTAAWCAWVGLRRLLARWRMAGYAPPLAAALAAALVGAHAAGTHARNEAWASEETLWRDVSEKSPHNGRGLMNYGLTLMSRGDYTRALEYFERARTYTPLYAHLHANIGVARSSLGDFAAAEPSFRRALELSPGFIVGRTLYAHALARHGRGPDAVAQAEKALRISESDINVRTLLARLYAASGDDQALTRIVNGTLALSPEDAVASAYRRNSAPYTPPTPDPAGWLLLGKSTLDAKSYLEAAEILRHLVQIDPRSAVAWNNLGWARLMLGFGDRAVEDLQRALALNPDLETARANLDYARSQSRAAAPVAPAEARP